MNVVFMGTPDFASGILEAVIKAGYTVTGVVTQPDRPSGRKKQILPGPVRSVADKAGIRVFQPERVRRPEAVEEIRSMEPDLIIVAAFGQIIPKAILDMPGFGCINVHASLLPAYRGASPIQHAILDGCSKTGVTIMRMDEGLDTGDIISRCVVPISDDETGGSLFDKLAEAGAKLLIETIPSIVDGTAVYTKQPAESTTPYARMISKEMGRIDWTKGADEIGRMVRAFSPWPSAWSTLDGTQLKIWRSHRVTESNSLCEGEEAAGSLNVINKKYLYVKTGDGILSLDEVQLAGRKRMSAEEFLRGYRIKDTMLKGEG